MSFAGKVWRLLVGIKDGLALLFLLIFFALLYAALSIRPSAGQVREGALLLDLDGSVVEEQSRVDPLQLLMSGTVPPGEYAANDLIRAIDGAAKDDRIKVIVLDLTRFLGGGQVHLQAVGEALDRAKAAGKPVLAFSTAYTDSGMLLAAHATEVWVDPLGGAILTGPGGNRLYYGDLLNQLKIKAHVFRVGTHKAAVEPYMRSDMSPEARENASALYGALWGEWTANVSKARPKVKLDWVTERPVEWLTASHGNGAKAALAAGLVDRIGDQVAFGKRVAKIAGEDPSDDAPGNFAHTDLDPWLAAVKPDKSGKAIGVVTIAGEIVDGEAGPGTAGGDRIADLLDDALDDDISALVVRVDSPGGSVLASEEIRRAIMRQKARGIPIVVSMANVAASGGYWVSTPADRIFAEPETITGSIGIFAVIPTFEDTLAHWGVKGDGVRTTPLSGQPDLLSGLSPEVEAMAQSYIQSGYARFLSLVSASRHKTPAEINEIAQGKVWDGGTARQLGLVDEYGGLDDALAYAAKQAKLKEGEWHPKFLGAQKPDPYQAFLRQMMDDSGKDQARGRDLISLLAAQRSGYVMQIGRDLNRLLGGEGAQVYCMECVQIRAADARGGDLGWVAKLVKLFAA